MILSGPRLPTTYHNRPHKDGFLYRCARTVQLLPIVSPSEPHFSQSVIQRTSSLPQPHARRDSDPQIQSPS